MSDTHPSTQFYGWRIVALGFIFVMLTVGSTTYAFGLFVGPVSSEFALTRSQVNDGLILLLVGMTAWGPIVGRLLDRYRASYIMALGAVLLASGFVLIATTHEPWVIVLAIAVPISFGATSGGALGASTVAARWFMARRGRAIGIIAVATSTGGFVVVPFMAALMEAYGWRWTLAIQGALLAVIISLLALPFMRNSPDEVGQVIDAGLPAPEGSNLQADARPWSIRELLMSRDFWFLGLGAGLLLGTDQALLASLIPYGIDRGFSSQAAAMLLSVLTASAIAGKLLIGWLADRFDKRVLFAFVALLNILFLLLLLSNSGYNTLIAGCALLGAAIGGVYPVWIILVASCFGRASYGIALGSMFWISLPCALISIRLAGVVRDRTGAYDVALITFIAIDVLAAILIFMLSSNAVRSRRQQARSAAGVTTSGPQSVS